MQNLSFNFSQTDHYLLAVRLAKVSRIRAIDPNIENLTEMTLEVQNRFTTALLNCYSLDVCLEISMKMYVLIDLTNNEDNLFKQPMLKQTLDCCCMAFGRSDLMAGNKVLAFCAMICVKVLALLYDISQKYRVSAVSNGFQEVCEAQLKWLCMRLSLMTSDDDTNREPFLEYMVHLSIIAHLQYVYNDTQLIIILTQIFNAVCFLLTKFMPQSQTTGNHQRITLYLDRVISAQLNFGLAAFIGRGRLDFILYTEYNANNKIIFSKIVSTNESMYQARGMIRTLTKLYKLNNSYTNISYPKGIFTLYHRVIT